MPTALPRVQALFPPQTYAKVRQLAKLNRRSSSYTVVDLVEELLQTEKYQHLLEYAEHIEGKVPTPVDDRTFIPQPRTVYPKAHQKETPQQAAATANWWEVA